MADPSSDMTLALSVGALRGLADPNAAIDDAREWTEYVGVVAEDANAGLNYTRNRRIRVDFFSGTRSIEETLLTVGGTYPTERHVLIGTDDDLASTASQCGWEYMSLEESAQKAGWELQSDENDTPGLLARLWPF